MSAPVPLALQARRLAPAVALGLVSANEALDVILEDAILRGALDRPGRIDTLVEWLAGVLIREAEAFLAKRAERRQVERRQAA